MKGLSKIVLVLVVFLLYSAVVLANIVPVGKVVSAPQEIFILVSENFWNESRVQTVIEQYQNDIFHGREMGSEVFTVEPERRADLTACEEIREFVQNQYYSGKKIAGVLLVGDVPWVNFKDEAKWQDGPCDIYFGDLDIIWKDQDGDGVLDGYECVEEGLEDCHIEQEIWVSRIMPPWKFIEKDDEGIETPHTFSFGKRVDNLVRFLEKDHLYWTKKYQDLKDFLHYNVMGSINGGCECYTYLYDFWKAKFPLETSDNFLLECCQDKYRYLDELTYPYKAIKIQAHGALPSGYSFGGGEEFLDAWEIYKWENIATIFIYSYSCSVCDFSTGGDMGMAYLFNPNSDVLAVVGCTTVCWTDDFPKRDYLRKGCTIGETVKQERGTFRNLEGDPLIKLRKEMPVPDAPTIISYDYDLSTNGVETKPEVRSIPGDAKPFLFAYAPNGYYPDRFIKLKVGFSGFEEPVDIYVGVDANKSYGKFFIWDGNNNLISWNGDMSSLVPWKTSQTQMLDETILTIKYCDVLQGEYWGYILVVPAGTDLRNFSWDSSSFYLWYFKRTIQ